MAAKVVRAICVLVVHFCVSNVCNAQALGISAADLAERLMVRDEKLRALALIYTEVPQDRSGRPEGGYLRRAIAARAPNWFMRDNGHGSAQMHWRDDPLRKCIYISPNRVLTFTPLNRVIHEGKPVSAGSAPAEAVEELIFFVLCWWPFSDWPEPEVYGRKWSMHSQMSSGEYSLRPALESVLGGACYVLEVPGVDVMWLDSEQVDCMMRRDVLNTETGAVAARLEFSDYQQRADGVWLPGSFWRIQFDSYAHIESLRKRRVIDARFLVSYSFINEQVDESVF